MIIPISSQSSSTDCVVCTETDNLASEHPCKTCNKEAWVICNICIPKLDKCPVCRTEFQNNSTTISNNTNHHVQPQSRYYPSVCDEIVKNICIFLKAPAFFIITVYVGKIYIYIYCRGTCPEDYKEKGKDCLCDEFARRNNYWGDFRHFPLELFVAIIVSALLFSCCCLKN